MKRVLLLPSILLLILGFICYLVSAGPFTVPLAAASQRPIVFCSPDDVKTLDINAMSWTTDIRAAMALWEGLATYDPVTLVPQPGIAERWDITDSGKTYTFHLRPNARWSDGSPVTALDFLFAWQRALTPATSPQYQELFYVIEGAKKFYEAMDQWTTDAKAAAEQQKSPPPKPDFSMVGVTAPNPQTLVVHLSAPCTYFLDLAAFPPFYPLQENTMKPFLIGDTGAYDGRWTHPPNLVTNGPYKLTDWRFKQYLLFEPNPHYWDRSNVKCAKLMMVPNKDGRAALLAYLTGAVDALSFVPQGDLGQELLAAKAQESSLAPEQRKWDSIHYRPVFGSYYYIFKCDREPFKDPKVRKALAMAIDRRKIVDNVMGMHQDPLGVLVPPGIPDYKSPPELPYDPAAARALLAEAGFPNGEGLRTIELLYSNDLPGHKQVAQAIGQMWKENLGAKVNVIYNGLDRNSFSNARQQEHNFDLARGGWYGDYTDPTTWLDLFRSSNGNNDGGYADPKFDKMMDDAAAEPDPAKRFALLTEAERYLTHDTVPYIPLYQYADGFIYDDKKIQGIDVNVRLLTEFKWIRRVE